MLFPGACRDLRQAVDIGTGSLWASAAQGLLPDDMQKIGNASGLEFSICSGKHYRPFWSESGQFDIDNCKKAQAP